MQRITVDQWKHLPAGSEVWNGYSNGYLTVPGKAGEFYTLHEVVDAGNIHAGWDWEKE